jgi:rRNA maturation protein Nop10
MQNVQNATALTPVTEAEQNVREAWLNGFVDRARPYFEAAGAPIPLMTRVSIGFTSAGHASPVIGECWSNEASEDGHFEIFLNPTTQSDSRLADILTHELCHAALGMAENHGKAFKALATALGLTGPMRSTIAGEGWYNWAGPILAELGPMPYAALRPGMKPPRKKKVTYTLKTECPECGWLARVTARHITPHSHLNCPVPDCGGVLEVEAPSDPE